MQEGAPTPQINVSKIPGGGGIAGTLFAVISLTIFLIGIPALRYLLVGAVLIGAAASLTLRTIGRRNPGTPCTLFAPAADSPNRDTRSAGRPDDVRRMLRIVSPLA